MFEGRLNLKTGPSAEPVTATEVKLYARVAHSVEDTIIEKWIKSAVTIAQDYKKQSFITQTWLAIFDDWPSAILELPMSPLQSVEAIKYYDTDNTEYTFSSSKYFVDTDSEVGRVALNEDETWETSVSLRPINSVIIEYIAGFGLAAAVPEEIKNAIYLFCTHMYENREAETDIPQAFFDLLGPGRMYM